MRTEWNIPEESHFPFTANVTQAQISDRGCYALVQCTSIVVGQDYLHKLYEDLLGKTLSRWHHFMSKRCLVSNFNRKHDHVFPHCLTSLSTQKVASFVGMIWTILNLIGPHSGLQHFCLIPNLLCLLAGS